MLHVKRSLQNLLLGVCVVDCQPIKTSTPNLGAQGRSENAESPRKSGEGQRVGYCGGVAVYCIYSYLILLHELATQTTIIAHLCLPRPPFIYCGEDCRRDTWLKRAEWQAGGQADRTKTRKVVKTILIVENFSKRRL